MRIAGVNPCSLVNGDGIRYVVFTQGCHHHCKGCQNPDTWDPKGGYDVSIYDLSADILKRWKRGQIDGITLSGGDPYYQTTECRQLLQMLPKDLNVWIYTGFDYEYIKDDELTSYADVIVDGKFDTSRKCKDGEPYGSTNQRIIHIYDKKLKSGEHHRGNQSFEATMKEWRDTKAGYERIFCSKPKKKKVECVEEVIYGW